MSQPRGRGTTLESERTVRRLRRPADTTISCGALFSGRLKSLGLTKEELCVRTGLTAPTIYRALAGGAVGASVLARIGNVLGIDVAHLALASFRDELRRCTTGTRKRAGLNQSSERPGNVEDESLKALWNACIAELTNHLAWQGTPYAASGRGLRLALREVRLAKPAVSRPKVAAAMKRLVPERGVVELERELKGYEHDLISLSNERLRLWLEAIGQARGEKSLSIEKLVQRAVPMRYLHRMSTTCEKNRMREAPGLALQVFHPSGGVIELHTLPTIYGALGVEIIETHNPSRDLAVILNARHHGLEIAYVDAGRVKLTLTRKPLEADDEKAGRHARLQGTELGRLRDVVAEHEIGPGEVVSFASGFYHRAEMIGRSVKLVCINLGRNLWLGRRYRGEFAP